MGTLKNPFLELGELNLSVASIVYLVGALAILFFAASRARRFVVRRLAKREDFNPNTESVISLAFYALMALAAVMILQSAGVQMSSLAVIGGAVGIGIGFGLQNIANNFISGIIILFERPIKVGDRVEVKDVAGQVVRIGMRASEILTNDNIAIIVPNSDFISSNVVNWSHTSDETVRLRIPIGITFDADPREVVRILEEVLSNVPGLSGSRKADVILSGFGENGFEFVARVWTKDFLRRPGLIRHQINLAIWDALKSRGLKTSVPRMEMTAVVKGVGSGF